MKRIIHVFLVFSCLSVFAQPCSIVSGLNEIEILNAKGNFEVILTKVNTLLQCEEITISQKVSLFTHQYKAYRNSLKFNDAELPLIKAKSLLENNNLPLSFDFRLLLAENYAHLSNIDKYNNLIQSISKNILSPSSPNDTILGRYYLTSFRITKKGVYLNQAIDHLQNAVLHFEKLEQPPIFYYSQALWSLGNMYRDAGDFDKSHLYLKKGKGFLDKHYPKNHFDIGYYDYKIGAVYYEKMEFQPALDHFLDARKVWVHYLKPQDTYMHYLNEAIGDMYWELGDPEKALIYFNYSTLDEEKINNDESSNTILLADSLAQNGNYADALEYYKQAYNWREQEFGKNNVQTGACKNFVARALHASGDTEGALTAYQEAISILVPEMSETSWYDNPTTEMNIQSHQYLLESLKSKGNLLKDLYNKSNDLKDLEAALDTQEIAISVLEDLKNNQLSETSREFWTNRTLSIIESSIETALQLHQITGKADYLNRAFIYSERSKAILLLASLYDQEINSFANVSEAIISEERKLKHDINDYIGKIQSEENRCAEVRGKMLSLWKNKLNLLQNDYELLVKKIKIDYPDYYQLKYNLEVANVSMVQKALLNNNTALVSYFTGSKNTYIYFITSEKITIRLIQNTEELFQQATTLFKNISSNQLEQNDPQLKYEDFIEVSNALYEKLLSPEINNRNYDKLIIIPDGKLCYLPIESLLTEKVLPGIRNYKKLPYLLRKSSISYSPSASILLLPQNNKKTKGEYVGFAPDYMGQKYSEDDDLYTGKKLSNLNFSSVEIENAAELFKGKSWTGKKVTEDLLKESASQAGILHFAMHGEVEDLHPMLSKLYFNSSEKEDGILHVYEIYNMNISAQLVILSACNTASGKLIRGEGILSLERAFQYAGGKSLLSTLWTVDDASSLKITELFLQNIKSGSPKDVALRDAKLHFIETASPEVLHPFFWSSFKLTGNTDPFIQNSNSTYLYSGLGIVSLFFGILYFRRQKKASKNVA